jgi:hypothetical protein
VLYYVVMPRFLQCRMQVQGKHALHGTRYSSPLDCAMKTLQSEGVCGLFRGGLATLFREAVGNAVFFCTYEYSRYWMHRYLDSPWFSGGNHLVLAKDVGVGIMSGGISGMAVIIYTYSEFIAISFFPFCQQSFYSAVLDSYSTIGCCKDHYSD